MSTAREQILGGIRKSLGRGALDAAAAAPLEARLARHEAGLIPARADGLDTDRLFDLFKRYAELADASVERIAEARDVPRAVTSYLARHNLPAEAAMSPDTTLDAYPWADQPLLRIRRGRAEDDDAVSITPAHAAVAETGTVMFASGADRPTTLNFLPGTQIVVLRADQLVGPYEEAWRRLRAQGPMPRAVNWVTGPSRTGDIEQRLQLGAHGPVRLHVIVVG